jgi:hypothetical protein
MVTHMASAKVHTCVKKTRSKEMGYKSKTAIARLRFMFHYCISPARQPTSPARLAPCPGAADSSPLEKIGDFWRFPATAALATTFSRTLHCSPLFALA